MGEAGSDGDGFSEADGAAAADGDYGVGFEGCCVGDGLRGDVCGGVHSCFCEGSCGARKEGGEMGCLGGLLGGAED